jgi:ATP-binding cassette subfamily B protein
MLDRSAELLGTEVRKARDVRVTLLRFWRYFRQYRLVLVLVALFVIAGTYAQVLIPDLTGQAVDCFLQPATAQVAFGQAGPALPGELGATLAESAASNCWFTSLPADASTAELLAGLGRLILLVVALFVISAFLAGGQFYLMAWAGQHVLRKLRAEIFTHIHRLSLRYFTQHEAGDIMSRLTNDTDTINQVIGFGLVSVVQGVLLIVWTVYTMFAKSAAYAAVGLVTLPLMLVATRWFSNQARKAFRQARQQIGNVNAGLQENIAAVREVQAFSREDESIEAFRASNAANRDANVRAQAFTSALAPTLEALSYVSVAIIAGVGGFLILGDQQLFGTTISLGLVITFIAYSQQFNRPVQQIALLWTNIQSAIAGGERIFDFLDDAPDMEDKAGAITMPPIVGQVRFENVAAAYNPGEPVLRGVSLTAEPGETIAIVGPTGAGKTTIINLIPRFYDVTGGRITIDGHDVRDVSRASLRQQIGMVLQDTFLFSDTVMNNIRYGRLEASDDEVIAAARLASADDFISRLPDGYQTVLGERGSGLSQGQRQLLAIARVILASPRLLILDEATSSVDTRTERQIQKALEGLLSGRTSFVVAHRLSTIRNADQVLVLRDGEIIERGRHADLLAAGGFYHELYMSQFRRELAEEQRSATPVSA